MLCQDKPYRKRGAGVPGLIKQNLKLIRHFGKVCVYVESTVYNVDVDWSQAPGGWSLCFSQDPEADYAGEVHPRGLDI